MSTPVAKQSKSPFSPLQRGWLWLAGLLALLCLALGWQLAAHWRWSGPLYCIQQRGLIWGVAPLPPTLTPTCPSSPSYRQEVLSGETKVEQYRVQGWQPKAALPLLQQAGYTLLTKELDSPAAYSIFLGRQLPGELQYTAIPEGPETLITISGR